MPARPPPIPSWFADEIIGHYALYPAATMGKTTILGWWRELCDFPRAAVEQAFRRARREAPDPQWMPSGELVRRVAESIAKTLKDPKPDFFRPALPEPEPTLPRDNPWCETLERFKRGEIPGRVAASEIVHGVAERTALGSARSTRAGGSYSESQGTRMRRVS